MSGGAHQAAARPEQLTGLLEPVVSAAGFDLESVKVGRAGRRGLLRVVVDSDHGVTLDDIAVISRAVAAEVDARDAMGPGAYTLEVSSPGVDRPLTEPRHWRRAAGRLVRVPLPTAGPAATAEGRVIKAGQDGVMIEIDGERREFGWAELGPGQVQVEFGKLADDDGGAPAVGLTGPESSAGDDADLAGGEVPDGH